MAGFFPVMMFGLPAACLAMYHTALPERRRAVGGLLGSIALTSFLTGVTEPIEFTFMFLAPVLYAVHAVLTGVALVIMNALHVRLGFGFSAGLFDYVLNFNRATRPLWLLPVGRGLLRALLRAVPLRHRALRPEDTRARAGGDAASRRAAAAGRARARPGSRPSAAPPTCVAVDACTTRLRLEVADQTAVDEPARCGGSARAAWCARRRRRCRW